MPKKPKREDIERKQTWSEDQKERGYYYDDAHGYEQYEPGKDDEEDTPSGSSTDDSLSEERGQAALPDCESESR